MTLDDERIQSLKDTPYAKNKKELQEFLVTCNYFMSFIKRFADIAGPLYQLLKNGVKYVWTHSQSNAVNILKRGTLQESHLKIPGFH